MFTSIICYNLVLDKIKLQKKSEKIIGSNNKKIN
jgi:hypothetical protein